MTSVYITLPMLGLGKAHGDGAPSTIGSMIDAVADA